MKVLGIAGYSGSGKTTLTETLLPLLIDQGLSVSTIKHAHHRFDVDTPGKDSWRHRQAGAKEVLVSSGTRWALMHELREESEPELAELLSHMSNVDLVLVEGFKRNSHYKIEVWRPGATDTPPLFPSDPKVIAVASDETLDLAAHGGAELPLLQLGRPRDIADFIQRFLARNGVGTVDELTGG